ncbi:D-alanyl-D-alanine carboxypeptidase family protein [Neobacillus dielmonensis]|uniref:D-alanyl-D-alanine carboxypeptidase family protein n=1 Tax=Neobacillus dielmonensis TaxID=1347369 RepID=UPI00069416EE|nr:D-alanyl-D-alanine carboxypeptidase family protein [Neobacillus dielmonensis]
MRNMKLVVVGLIGLVLLSWGIQMFGMDKIQRGWTETSSDSSININGEAGILLDADSGKAIYAKNSEKRMYPASTTKILTALLAIEWGSLDDSVTVGKEVRLKSQGESTAWLKEGQSLTLRELLAGLMLPSGNDAARTIAIYTAKKQMGRTDISDETALSYFVRMMNQKAKQLGAKDSHFMNPHGLHNSKHYTTAHDLGLIAMAAMENQSFKDIVSSRTFSDQAITYENRNQLLNSNSPYYFEGANGIKTGFTDEAGYCLVSAAERNGKKLIAVILKSDQTSVWNDSITLLKKGFTTEYVNN